MTAANHRTHEPGAAVAAVATSRLDGPAVEQEVVRDMLKRAAFALPALVAVNAAFWGWQGAASSAFASAVVLVNFALAAALLAWTARISLGLMMGTALFGYLIRLALVGAAIMSVRDAGWAARWPLGLTLIVTHLGLLLWETRYVSASLAFPGLKPAPDTARGATAS